MLSNMVPEWGPRTLRGPLDVGPLAYALSRMTPGLWAPILPGESFEDALTRREAARDILDDLLREYDAAGPLGGVS